LIQDHNFFEVKGSPWSMDDHSSATLNLYSPEMIQYPDQNSGETNGEGESHGEPGHITVTVEG